MYMEMSIVNSKLTEGIFQHGMQVVCDNESPTLGTRTHTEFRVPKNGNQLDHCFLQVFERTGDFRHIFSFILRQVTMDFRVPRNGNPHWVFKNQESCLNLCSQRFGIGLLVLNVNFFSSSSFFSHIFKKQRIKKNIHICVQSTPRTKID